jgi:hypothetical protein
MVVGPIGSTTLAPPVSPVSAVARVVRRAVPGKGAKASGARDLEDEERPLAAPKTPVESSSSATQQALTKLELGG